MKRTGNLQVERNPEIHAPVYKGVRSHIINLKVQIKAPEELNFDYYQLVGKEQAVALEQIDIIHKFASNILDNIKDLDPEFSKTVDENFWGLI